MNKIRILIGRLIDSYQSSNHFQHMVTGIILAIFGTIITAYVWARMKETHDAANGGIYDKSDIAWTMVGGALGQILQIIIILTIINL